MKFKLILLILSLFASFVFSKPILRKQDSSNQTNVIKANNPNRSDEEIININFEEDLSGWTQDNSNGWELSGTESQ